MVDIKEVAQFLETAEGQALVAPKIDAAVTKGIQTFRTKTMPDLIEAEIVKRNPAETPAEKRLRQIETELAQERKARAKETQKLKIIQSGINANYADFLVGDSEEQTQANVKAFTDTYNVDLEERITKKLGADSGRRPENNVVDIKDLDGQIKVAQEGRDVAELIRLKNLKLQGLKA